MLGRLRGAIRGLRVDQAAPVARALSSLVGELPDLELLPGGPPQVTRAVLTARWLATSDPVPWPAAVMRQLDPDDPAFLPALGMHPVLAARDRTLLGLPGRAPVAWVDALGWAGVGVGPSVSVWAGSDKLAFPMGRRPDELGTQAPPVTQARSDEGVGVRTVTRRGDLELVLMHWPVVLEGEVAWAVHARLQNHGEAPVPARLAFVLRPACGEGAAPVFHLSRDGDGLWTADGRPLLAMARAGEALYLGRHGSFDPWLRFSGQRPGDPQAAEKVDVRCRHGQASAVEVTREVLAPGESVTRLAVLAPPKGTSAALVRTSGPSLWSGASADRRGMLSAGSGLTLSAHQAAFEAARTRLLLEPPAPGMAAFLGAVALARMGFTRRAEDRLARVWSKVRRDGSLPGEAEDAAALAWATAEVVRWSGDTAWARAHQKPWARLLDRLAQDEPRPGGRALFGAEGSVRFTAIWRAAGLLASAEALRELAPDARAAWALAGGRQREALPELLGPSPWTAAPGRAVDGSAAAMLTGCWLGVVDVDHPGAVATARRLRARHWHGGGVLHLGGAHAAATALLAGVMSRLEPKVDWIGAVAALASGTGALPTARHPYRGAVGEGDDLLGAALFALLVLDQVRVLRGRLVLLPGITCARDLPTPHGRIDIEADDDGRRRVQGRWRGTPPEVLVLQGPGPQRAPGG
jgi:hypothetical protein